MASLPNGMELRTGAISADGRSVDVSLHIERPLTPEARDWFVDYLMQCTDEDGNSIMRADAEWIVYAAFPVSNDDGGAKE